jgi:uncharacterized protein with PQ loop repeat
VHPVVVLSLSLAATALSLGRTLPQFIKTIRTGDLSGVSASSWLFVALSGIVWLPLNVHYGNIAGIVVEVVSIPLATVVAWRAWRANRETFNEVQPI